MTSQIIPFPGTLYAPQGHYQHVSIDGDYLDDDILSPAFDEEDPEEIEIYAHIAEHAFDE